MPLETVLTTVMLGGFIWVVGFQLPKATRERDRLGIIYAVVAALVALIGWLFIGITARSR